MPAATQTQIHHALVQDLLTGKTRNTVLVELNKRGRFNIESAENLISLPNDVGLAGRTGVTRHASSHTALLDAIRMRSSLSAFGNAAMIPERQYLEAVADGQLSMPEPADRL